MDDHTDKGRFAVAIGAMLEAFGQEATKPRLHGYWLGLRSLEIEQVERAVAEVLESVSERFPPPPAKLREIVSGGSSDERAMVAWADVEKAMPVGAYRHVDFEDGAINAAIRMLGGWPTLFERCATTDGEKWYRIEFCKAYARAASGGVSGDVCRPLAGLSEMQVIGGVRREPAPIRIAAVDRKRISNGASKRIGHTVG